MILRHESAVFFLSQEHFVNCEYEDETCDDCNEMMQRRLLHKHITSECPNRMVQCEHCEKEFAYCHTAVRLLKYNDDLALIRIGRF